MSINTQIIHTIQQRVYRNPKHRHKIKDGRIEIVNNNKKGVRTMADLTGAIIDYEMGSLSEDETIELFQALIDSGLAWSLQGSYGRTAKDLIEAGDCYT